MCRRVERWGAGVAPCDIITVKHACSFLGPSPLHHPALTLPSVSNPVPVYRTWVAGPRASPVLNTIHFNNTTSLQAAGKQERKLAGQSVAYNKDMKSAANADTD